MFTNRVRKIIEDFKVDLPNAGVYTDIAGRIYGDARQLLRLLLGMRDGTGYSSDRRRMEFVAIEEQIQTDIGGTSYQLTKQIPPNSIIMACCLNFDTAITLATAVKVGVGLSTAGTTHLGDCVISGTVMTKNTPTTGITPVVDAAVPVVIGTGLVRASGTTTMTSAAHGLVVGDKFRITGCSDITFNGDYTVLTRPTTGTLTFAQANQPDATPTTPGYFSPYIKLNLACLATDGSAAGTFNGAAQKVRVQAIYSHISDLQPAA